MNKIHDFDTTRAHLLEERAGVMDYHINEFFQRRSEKTPRGNFHDVIPLHQTNDLSYQALLEIVPDLPKGWYELSKVSSRDRIEFTYGLWSSKLPFHPKLEKCLERFFSSLDDIGIFIVQNQPQESYSAQMVYSLLDNGGFYRGGIPADERAIAIVKANFSDYILPEDYLAFQRIHDGFWKTTDSTGISKAAHLSSLYDNLQVLLAQEPVISTSNGDPVNPKALIPFYESFGMPYFQCFWAEWYPEQEMGNVYYSSESKTISNVKGVELGPDSLSFPTFSDWLSFYLERVD